MGLNLIILILIMTVFMLSVSSLVCFDLVISQMDFNFCF